MTRAHGRSTLLATCLLFALIAALGAQAGAAEAATLTLNVSRDAAEDRPLVVTASGAADADSTVIALIRNAGGAPCGPTYDTDVGGDEIIFNGVSAGSFSLSEAYEASEPRRYLLCGWVRRNGGADARASLEFAVRSNAATLTLELPTQGTPGQPVVAAARGTTEVERSLRATYKPAGGAACGSSYSTDSGGSDLFYQGVSGAFAETTQHTFDPGAYLVCAWIQEGSDDLQPEASASATISVQPPDGDGDGVPDAGDRCPTRPGTGTTGCPPRVAPSRFSARATPVRDRRAPYRFSFSGRLTPPAGVPATDACRGNVAVQIKRGRKTISTRRRGVRKNCTWRSSVAFAQRSRVGRSGRLKVSVRFLGNDVLLPRGAKALHIRAG